jgi:hypothetical protein
MAYTASMSIANASRKKASVLILVNRGNSIAQSPVLISGILISTMGTIALNTSRERLDSQSESEA